MTPNPNWLVTVQAPMQLGAKLMPGYVQIDECAGGANQWSKGPEQLRAEGYDFPDFSGLPQGQYTFTAANIIKAKTMR